MEKLEIEKAWMESGSSRALEIERVILKYNLSKETTAKKSDSKLKPILLPDKPEENWAYKNKSLSPIYLPGQ